jgi:outer membrane protein assembly factor BamB
MLYVSARYYDTTYGRRGVFRIDPRTGDYLGTLVNDDLLHIAFGPAGDLYGVDLWSRGLLRYDGLTGAFKQTILKGSDFGYYGVGSFTFLPDGSIFAVTRSDQVARYDLQTGEQIGPLTDLSGMPAELGLTGAGFDGMALGPDGKVYVAYDFYSRSGVLNAGVMRFDGETGTFLDFVMRDVPAQGAASGGSLGVAFGPQGDLYVGSQYAKAVFRYDPATGTRLGTLPLTGFVTGASHLAFLMVPEPSGVGLFCAAFLFAIGQRFRWRMKSTATTHA